MRWLLWVSGFSLPVVAAMGFHSTWPDDSEVLDHFGGFLAGYAALMAVGFAAVTGSLELERWNERRAIEKRADVAGQAIVAAIRFVGALKTMTTFFPKGDEADLSGDMKFEDVIAKVFAARQQQIAPDVDAFRSAGYLAEAFLPPNSVTAMRELWNVYDAIIGGWHQVLIYAPAKPEERRYYSEPAQKAVFAARDAMKDALDRAVRELRQYTATDGSIQDESHSDRRS